MRGTKIGGSRIHPEAQLALICARTRFNAAQATEIRRLCGLVHWPAVIQCANRHRIVPLVYSALIRSPDLVPRIALEELAYRYHCNLGSNLRHAGELIDILNAFQAHGIHALPFKGLATAVGVYGDLSLRSAGDLDILIDKRNAVQSGRLLASRGFHLGNSVNSDGFPSDPAIYELHFERDADGTVVELRWRVTEPQFPASFDFDTLWQRRQTISLTGARVDVLSQEDAFPINCIHGAKHGWRRLSWICDIAETLHRYPELNWSQVYRDAQRLGVGRLLQLAVTLAAGLLDAPIPLEELQSPDSTTRSLADLIRSHLFEDLDFAFEDDPSYRYRLLERRRDQILYRLRPHLQSVWAICRKTIPNERDRAYLPAAVRQVRFLQYLVRPARLAKEWASQSWLFRRASAENSHLPND